MAHTNSYLFFNRNCRKAMEFYNDCFGGNLTITKISDTPVGENAPSEVQDNIIHANLATEDFTLLASDNIGGKDLTQGNTTVICLSCDSEDEINTLFDTLSEGGDITQSLEQAFFGTIGQLTDKFGVSWMLEFSQKE